MSKTKIEWSEHTWNPVTGCSPISEGCHNCYARRMARRLAGRCGYPEAPHHFDVTLRPDRLDIPLQRKKPTTYFVCSMSDLFHENVPFEFITQVFDVMCDARSQHHVFQLLTKRPERINKWLNWVAEYWNGNSPFSVDWEVLGYAANVWLGASIENQPTADERIPLLLQTPAAVHFVSVEPMLEPVDLWVWKKGLLGWNDLDWVICGGETGPGARPMHPDWARSLRDQCQASNTPFFFKHHGEWLHSNQQTGQPLSGAPHWWGERLEARNVSYHVGKKAAGRLLDGREWNEMPGGK